MVYYKKNLIICNYFLKESSKNFSNVHFLEHQEKFKPILYEISQLNIQYDNTNTSQYNFKSHIIKQKINLINNDLYYKPTNAHFNWDQLEVMKFLNYKHDFSYSCYIKYNPMDIFNILDIKYILNHVIEINLLQVGIGSTSVFLFYFILKYFELIRIKILNFFNLIIKDLLNEFMTNNHREFDEFIIKNHREVYEFIIKNHKEIYFFLSYIILFSTYSYLKEGFLSIINIIYKK
jgi:hypothetical protein